MVNDWESAFEACPPYGEGKGAYGPAMPAGAAATTFTAGASTGPGRPWRSGRRSTAGAAAHLRNGRGYDIVLARDRPEPLPADGFEVAPPR